MLGLSFLPFAVFSFSLFSYRRVAVREKFCVFPIAPLSIAVITQYFTPKNYHAPIISHRRIAYYPRLL